MKMTLEEENKAVVRRFIDAYNGEKAGSFR